jgi:hypothetical protein
MPYCTNELSTQVNYDTNTYNIRYDTIKNVFMFIKMFFFSLTTFQNLSKFLGS